MPVATAIVATPAGYGAPLEMVVAATVLNARCRSIERVRHDFITIAISLLARRDFPPPSHATIRRTAAASAPPWRAIYIDAHFGQITGAMPKNIAEC